MSHLSAGITADEGLFCTCMGASRPIDSYVLCSRFHVLLIFIIPWNLDSQLASQQLSEPRSASDRTGSEGVGDWKFTQLLTGDLISRSESSL